MRTTLTLEDDVTAMLRHLAQERKLSFKEAVNTALREGLLSLEKPPQQEAYRTKPRSMGVLPGVDYDKVGQLADELDDQSKVSKGQ